MSRIIRALARQGMFEPVEAVAVPDGTKVTVTILGPRSAEDAEIFQRSAGGWKGLVDLSALPAVARERRR